MDGKKQVAWIGRLNCMLLLRKGLLDSHLILTIFRDETRGLRGKHGSREGELNHVHYFFLI